MVENGQISHFGFLQPVFYYRLEGKAYNWQSSLRHDEELDQKRQCPLVDKMTVQMQCIQQCIQVQMRKKAENAETCQQ